MYALPYFLDSDSDSKRENAVERVPLDVCDKLLEIEKNVEGVYRYSSRECSFVGTY